MVINGWYDGDAHRGIERLALFTEFSPEYAPGSGDVLTNTKVNLFDFRGFVAAFDNARARNPTLDHWNLAQSALALHLSGGDPQAYGGSLAYEYARTGTSASGMDPVFARMIGSPDFGSIAQNVLTTTGSPDPILI